jgi:molybdopterin synthase catalytic subunit
MAVRVLLFGPEAAAAGRAFVDAPVDAGATAGRVKEAVGRAFPALARSVRSARLAVNAEFAPDDQVIEAGDEVALIGLVSGG